MGFITSHRSCSKHTFIYSTQKPFNCQQAHSIKHCIHIIPHPATSYETIFTAMISFQDILKQKGLANGPLWSDKGVYRLAKEIQLLQPDKCINIFLGIGGFHLEKVVISCIGKYLDVSAINDVLAEKEIFGPNVVNSALEGNHYANGKRAINIIVKALQKLQITSFIDTLMLNSLKIYGKSLKNSVLK